MIPSQRMKMKRLLESLEDYVGEISGVAEVTCEPTCFPVKAVGTDGGCWTDNELWEYAKDLCRNVTKTIKKLSAKPEMKQP